MKTQIITLALIFTFTMVSASVHFDGTNSDKKRNVITSIKVADFFECENNQELEDWMISFSKFHSGSEFYIEDKLQFEPWMLKSFAVTNDDYKSFDEELKFEQWMMGAFEIAESENFREEEMSFESWMMQIWI